MTTNKKVTVKKVEPKQRKDGKCAVPTCRKPLPPLALRMGDPFCSTTCCKQHYGINGGDE